MTVGELIGLLQKHPQDAKVLVENPEYCDGDPIAEDMTPDMLRKQTGRRNGVVIKTT
jgi:hypothetical protein